MLAILFMFMRTANTLHTLFVMVCRLTRMKVAYARHLLSKKEEPPERSSSLPTCLPFCYLSNTVNAVLRFAWCSASEQGTLSAHRFTSFDSP